jgi:hypothetical protein
MAAPHRSQVKTLRREFSLLFGVLHWRLFMVIRLRLRLLCLAASLAASKTPACRVSLCAQRKVFEVLHYVPGAGIALPIAIPYRSGCP